MAPTRASLRLLATCSVLTLATSHGRPHGSTITINPDKKYQSFDGMGFAEAFQRCTQIYGSDGLSEANTERVLDLLFSNENGAGLTILRNGIGSSLTNPYDLMKTIEPDDPGSPDATPQYDWQGTRKPGFGLDSGQLRMTKDAIARGVQTVYADAWSAPGFMKNNSNDSHGGALCGVSGIYCASGDWRPAYADYLVQYLKYYQQEGIDIDYVGFLNEPDLITSYASMVSNGEQAADFLNVLYPTLQKSGLKTQIACCDGSGWEQQRQRLTGIQKYRQEDTLGIVTAHGYSSPPSTPFHTTKKVWQTEWADLDGPPTLSWYYNGSTGEGLTWANHIQQAYSVSNVSAFLYWIGADNTTSNSALILLDGSEVHVSKRLWAFAQWSRFVKPGAVRIDAQSSDQHLNATAFQNADKSIAVQVINNSGRTQRVDLQGLPGNAVKTYLTDNDNDLTAEPAHVYRGRIFDSIPAYAMKSYITSSGW